MTYDMIPDLVFIFSFSLWSLRAMISIFCVSLRQRGRFDDASADGVFCHFVYKMATFPFPSGVILPFSNDPFVRVKTVCWDGVNFPSYRLV